jgi:hypothetical protein
MAVQHVIVVSNPTKPVNLATGVQKDSLTFLAAFLKPGQVTSFPTRALRDGFQFTVSQFQISVRSLEIIRC